MMGRYVLAGVLAGLAGGVVFGLMMQFITAPAPDDGQIPMMQMVANVVRSDNLAVGWIYHLFNSAVLGASSASWPGIAWAAMPLLWVAELCTVWCGGS
jgi:hypothetical protein